MIKKVHTNTKTAELKLPEFVMMYYQVKLFFRYKNEQLIFYQLQNIYIQDGRK
jgi:hypothetical protein